jgi:LSD1 subclass zinc finger protein
MARSRKELHNPINKLSTFELITEKPAYKMTIETSNDKKDPEIIYNAIQLDEQKPDDTRPTAVAGPPIPEGHERFYCSQCNTHYDLPNKATSWRCQNCHHFNSITPGECEWCTIL